MALKENNLELLEQYIDGTLPEDQQKEVEQRMAQDPAFKKEHDELKALIQGIRYSKSVEMLGRLREEENRITGAAPDRQAEVVRMQPWKRAIAVAALLMGLTFGGYFIYLATEKGDGTTDIYASYFEPAPNYEVPSVRGQAQGYKIAFQNYNAGDFQTAIAQFEEYLALDSDPEVSFYLAVSYMVEEEPQKAINILEELQSKDFQFSDDAKWYLSLAYINSEQDAKAKPLLKELADTGSAYSVEADQILKHL